MRQPDTPYERALKQAMIRAMRPPDWEPAPPRRTRFQRPGPNDPWKFNFEPRLDPAEAERRIQKSQQYWTAYRAGQAAKCKADIPYTPPAWFGARKKIARTRRAWIPGEHALKNPAK